jgi:hypothetical protein
MMFSTSMRAEKAPASPDRASHNRACHHSAARSFQQGPREQFFQGHRTWREMGKVFMGNEHPVAKALMYR